MPFKSKKMGLVEYLVRRAVYSFLLVLAAIFLVFILTHLISSNPAAVWAGPRASKSLVQAIAVQYHFNQPVYVQFYYYLIQTLSFNFGNSPFFKQPVSSLIAEYLPRTLELDLVAMGIAIVIGVFSGAFAAAHQDKSGDYSIRAIYLVSWCTPPFLAALLLQLFFAYDWKVLPPSQIADPTFSTPVRITGLPIIDALIRGNYAYLDSALLHAVLPTLALAFISFGIITRIMRSTMLESLDSDYVRTAIMKGSGKTKAVYVHAFRNSLLPVITVIALSFAYIITSSVIVELVFSYEGIGWLVTQALDGFDYPTLIACTVVITIFVIVVNF